MNVEEVMFSKTTKSGSEILEKVVTPTSLIIVDGDVVKVYTNPDVEYSDESANENIDSIWELVKDRKVYHLFVPDSSTYISVEARKYKHEAFEKIKLAQAIVIRTLGHAILAQFYKNAAKDRRYPIQIFNSEAKALQWFDELRKEKGLS